MNITIPEEKFAEFPKSRILIPSTRRLSGEMTILDEGKTIFSRGCF